MKKTYLMIWCTQLDTAEEFANNYAENYELDKMLYDDNTYVVVLKLKEK